MKKTLTTITLTGLAVSAIANPMSDKTETIPLANVNINLPTGGAKPLAKIDTAKNSSVESITQNKNREIGVLPIPHDEKESKSQNTVDSSNVEVKNVSEKKSVAENIEVKDKSNIKIKTSDIKKKNSIDSNKSISKSANTVVPSNQDKSILVEKNTNQINSDEEIKKEENVKAEQPTIDKKSAVLSQNNKNLPKIIEEPQVLAPVTPNNLSVETKDVTTVLTLEKKETINHVVEKEISSDTKNNIEKNIKKTTKDPIVKKETSKKISAVKKKTTNVSNPKVIVKTPVIKSNGLDLVKKDNEHILDSNDITSNVFYNPHTKQFLVKMEHKAGYSFRHSDFSNILHLEGGNSSETPILLNWTNSTLDKMIIIKSSVNENGEYIINVPQSQGKCEAFYVTYKLINDKTSITQSIILDHEGNPSVEMDRKCRLPNVQQKESIHHTKSGFVVSTNWNNLSDSIKKPVKFSSIISKDGQEVTPTDLRYIILSEDFTNFYYSVGVPNRVTSLGTTFTQSIPSVGNHYFTSLFLNDDGKQQLNTIKRYINP